MSVDQRIISRNPATNEPIWSGYLADDATIARAVSTATRAQRTWEATPLDARKDIIRAFADQVTTQKYRRSSTPMINGLRQLQNKSMDASR